MTLNRTHPATLLVVATLVGHSFNASAQAGEEDAELPVVQEEQPVERDFGREQPIDPLDDERSWRSADIKHGELDWDLQMRLDVITQNNQDFRALDESTDDAVRFSDDRHTDAYTRFSPAFRYRPVEQVEFKLRLQTDILWGTDLDTTTGGTDRDEYLLANFALRELALRYRAFESDEAVLDFELGRQRFEIGLVPRDYVFDYNIDAITATLDLGNFGRIRAVIFEIFGGSDPSDTLARVAYEADRQQFAGYRGKTNTYRSGLVYDWVDQDVVPGLGLAAYYFFTKVGANCQGASQYSTGNDISYCGELGNFVDNDYVHNYGLRAAYELRYGAGEEQPPSPERDEDADIASPDVENQGSSLLVYAEFGRSDGIDRKEPQQFDQETDGNMFGGGLELSHRFGPRLGLQADLNGYYFEGSQYASNGQRFEHGYVGMRGRRMGGLLAGFLSGWRPSPTMNNFGIDNEPYDRFRIGGTAFGQLGLGVEFFETLFRVDAFLYADTNDTFVTNFPEGGESGLPAGYAGDEVDAQRNLGELLGTEINVTLGRELVADLLRVQLQGGVFLPGDFYHFFRPPTVTNDDLVIGGGDDLGAGEKPFWAFRLGVEFDL